jgi:phage tail sheath protein FI
MASLVSPGVVTQLIDDSLFVPSIADTVPLFFVATQANKRQPDGVQTALGTIESNTVRTVTSLKQSTQLYGVPSFLEDSAGRPLHGDARNEVGLFTLNRFLGIGDLAYVVRADVNLNDDYTAVSADWISRTTGHAAELRALADSYLNSYNVQNGFEPGDSGYRETINASELGLLTRQVLTPLFSDSTFARAEFDFYDDNAEPAISTSGFQAIDFGGGLTAGLATGLANSAQTYNATVIVNGTARSIVITGSTAQTFGDLVTQLNAALGTGTATATVAINGGGNLVITSDQVGSASSIQINDLTLFNSLTGYISLLLPVVGVTADSSIDVFGNGFNQPPTGSYPGWDGYVNMWVAGLMGGVLGTEWTVDEAENMLLDAASDYRYTQEFANKTSLGANDAAKRVMIVEALQAVINSNTEIRSELYEFNLIVCPGFPEVVDDMLTLCEDVGEEAFVIGDVPYNLDPEQAANWGNAPATAANSRRVSRNVAYYYPHAIGSNLDGADVFVPASAIAVRTYTFSDREAELWFAPAGPRRGQVTGVSRIGFLTGTLGQPTTFVDVALNKGQRNALYQYNTNINPIANIPGRGILVFGQKTSQSFASALDRVNVARLVAYVRRQARKLAFGYLFEPNDQITRDNLKTAIDGMLRTILVKRGLVDYLTVCDESNNPPEVVDRNEMYVDVALKPTKAVEFIIIPIRVVAQGANLSAGS